MMRLPSSLVLGALALLPSGGCPSSDSQGNPTTLWLSPIGNDETRVQLVDTEPPPF
ncbi:MAG TPA: hypothetical protein VHW23_29770 [Kofleriaceae bacterium]|jgi:hypothetical protein|nr:hypothetical protein [Kofleriaceae bacterium]